MRARWKYIFSRASLALLLLMLIAASTILVRTEQAAAATTIRVNSAVDKVDPTDGMCTLREAIMAANTDTTSGQRSGECPAGRGLDTILLEPLTRYTLEMPELVIKTSLNLVGAGAGSSVIDGNRRFRVLRIDGKTSPTVRISRLQVSNGKRGVFLGDEGAGIRVESGAFVVLENSEVSLNETQAAPGGGIANFGRLHINATSVIGNASHIGMGGGRFQGNGGGIYNATGGFLYVLRSRVIDNEGTRGGGISNGQRGGSGGRVEIVGSIISNNRANTWGGGIANFGNGKVYIGQSTIANNLAIERTFDPDEPLQGGGIFNEGDLQVVNSVIEHNSGVMDLPKFSEIEFGGGIANFGTASIRGTTLNANEARGGAGIYNQAGVMRLVNSTISGNTASHSGGGGIFNDGLLFLNNITIAFNQSFSGGGLKSVTAAKNTLFWNTLIALNADGSIFDAAPDCAGEMTSRGHNLIGDRTNCSVLLFTGDLVGGGGLPVLDPRLDPNLSLNMNPFPARTHRLMAGSGAIDMGWAVPPAPPGEPGSGFGFACEITDQRGVARPQGPACDIGAFELRQNSP